MGKKFADVRDSFWFLPAVMAFGAAVLAVITVAVDEEVNTSSIEGDFVYAGGPEGARTLLGTIAASMIGVAGVSFSITVASLTLASGQFGPRILRNFTRDRGNQVVLGTFIAGFIDCLLVLRTVRGTDGDDFVPYISVTVGLVLALAGLAVLIYFIHHVSTSIQATSIVAAIGREFDHAVERMFPGTIGAEPPPDAELEGVAEDVDREGAEIPARKDGYVQGIDLQRLLSIAIRDDLVIRMRHRPGHFVSKGTALASVVPKASVSAATIQRLQSAVFVGDHRTPDQDVEFSVDQLVEIAVRALSPGVNDPFTAMACLERLGAGLRRLAVVQIPSPYRHDDSGRLRVIAWPVDFEGVFDAALNQIRQYGAESAAVAIRMLEVIAGVAEVAEEPDRRRALLRHAVMIERGSRQAIKEELDLQAIEERYRAVVATLSETEPV